VVDETKRATLDLAEYMRNSQSSACFICELVAGTIDSPHEVVYRDDFAIAFLNRFPTLLGYCLVAPLDHRVDVIRDFTAEEYLRLQDVVRNVGLAISEAVPTERVYIMSLGSNQGNAHVHWHVAPLPPGVPYEDQQFKALMLETNGYIDLSPEEQRRLATEIRKNFS
jgi:diadenosine tetraphosphate (Ap4A) HIT family hydrolase